MRFSSATLALLLCHRVACFTAPKPSGKTTALFTASVSDKKQATYSREEIQKIQAETEQLLKARHDNEAWNALFVSCPERPEPTPITEIEGEIPADFPPGCLLRLGPNGAVATDGFFDGDGMIQSISFPPRSKNQNIGVDSQSMFSATYIETKGRQLEASSENQAKFKGTLGGVPRAYPMIQSIMQNAIHFKTLQAQKDTCNTALAEHGGRILALMEQCPPTEIEILKNGQVKTIQASITLGGAIDSSTPITGGSLSAHGRTCPTTGERVHVSYRSDQKPYLRMDVFDIKNSLDSDSTSGWNLKESRGVDIPTPIFLHDSCMTENYVVVLDLPLTLRTSRILQDRFPVEYEPDHPARIGLVPRRSNSDPNSGVNDTEVIWFGCEPGVILHASNAWETNDGKTVIIQGFRGEPTPQECYLEQFTPSYFYEYSIDLITGKVSEKTLNPEYAVEFPVTNDKFHGRECSSCYCLSVASMGGPLNVYMQPKEGVSFGTILKLSALDTGIYKKGDIMGRYDLSERWFLVSEPTVLPKKGKRGEGEYVVFIATNVPEGVSWETVASDYDESTLESKVIILDGDNLDKGPLYSATLPYHVPYGLHSAFIDWEYMK